MIGGADKCDAGARREALETIVQLAAPMMPHLAESCWEVLGHSGFVAATPWPKFEAALTASDTLTIAVQVNGKLRGTIDVARGTDKAAMEQAALALETVARALDGKPPRRVIVVPERIVNIVA